MLKSYVLRSGRITNAQERCYGALRETFCVPYCGERLDCAAIFGNANPTIIEIGFGSGIATAQIAAANPQYNYLGIEVFRAGIGKLLWRIEQMNLANIRIIEHDAVEVLQTMIAPDSILAFHIFFPDPWPKKRHHKRRLIQRPFTNLLSEKLRDGGYIYFVSDWNEYADFALAELTASDNLVNCYAGFAPHQDWRPETRFERKGIDAQHDVREIMFKKPAIN
jgi:tRNA (guanine-N7-)-methyltransferase